jgi:uncharacterized protein (DUF1501 family)
MRRREFLGQSAITAALISAGSMPRMMKDAYGEFAPVDKRFLVNLTLDGGPDFRHVFPPAYDAKQQSYRYKFWSSRAASYNLPDNKTAWRKHWDKTFYHVNHNGVQFGILKKCQGLKARWDAGKLAIVCNAVGAKTRDHALSILVLDQRNIDSGPNDLERSGWGRRLASAASANVVSVSYVPRGFCNGLHPSSDINLYDNQNLVGAPDTRLLGLVEVNDDNRVISDNALNYG